MFAVVLERFLEGTGPSLSEHPMSGGFSRRWTKSHYHFGSCGNQGQAPATNPLAYRSRRDVKKGGKKSAATRERLRMDVVSSKHKKQADPAMSATQWHPLSMYAVRLEAW